MSIREVIDELDTKVRRLKVEYDQYFIGILKREPAMLREDVEKLVLNFSNRQISNTSLKFKFNSIVAKFNSYKQYWNRTLRAIEEGTFVRKPGKPGMRAPVAGTAEREVGGAREPKGAETGEKASDDYVKDIYSKYIEARKECNEPVKGISPDVLAKKIDKTIRDVESRYKTRDVDVKVYVKDGKARLAITPKKKKMA